MTALRMFRVSAVAALALAGASFTSRASAQELPYVDPATVRLQVSPKETEVYIDGYYSGLVDDFDGVLQRLRLDPGAHDITLYLAGYRTVSQKLQLEPRGTFRIKQTMEKLAEGETAAPRPAAPAPPPRDTRGPVTQPPRPPFPGDAGPRPQPRDPEQAFGLLAVRAQPRNADILIDGERWETSGSDDRLTIELSAGPHHIEIRRDGYRSYVADVDVRPGDTTTLNVSLSRP